MISKVWFKNEKKVRKKSKENQKKNPKKSRKSQKIFHLGSGSRGLGCRCGRCLLFFSFSLFVFFFSLVLSVKRQVTVTLFDSTLILSEISGKIHQKFRQKSRKNTAKIHQKCDRFCQKRKSIWTESTRQCVRPDRRWAQLTYRFSEILRKFPLQLTLLALIVGKNSTNLLTSCSLKLLYLSITFMTSSYVTHNLHDSRNFTENSPRGQKRWHPRP